MVILVVFNSIELHSKVEVYKVRGNRCFYLICPHSSPYPLPYKPAVIKKALHPDVTEPQGFLVKFLLNYLISLIAYSIPHERQVA